MNLRPGCPLVVAPRFHLPIEWRERVLLGMVEAQGDRFTPGSSWRAPTEAELAVLVGDLTLLSRDEILAGGLCLFGLPQHLRSAWWDVLERAGERTGPECGGFDSFTQEVARFLDFKELPVPECAGFDLLVSKPGQRAIEWPGEASRPRLWGGINLGEEAFSLVFVNRTAEHLRGELADQFHGLPTPTVDEQVRCFLASWPKYPLVRLRVEPGEGFRLPAVGLGVDVSTLDAQDPSVMLVVRAATSHC